MLDLVSSPSGIPRMPASVLVVAAETLRTPWCDHASAPQCGSSGDRAAMRWSATEGKRLACIPAAGDSLGGPRSRLNAIRAEGSFSDRRLSRAAQNIGRSGACVVTAMPSPPPRQHYAAQLAARSGRLHRQRFLPCLLSVRPVLLPALPNTVNVKTSKRLPRITKPGRPVTHTCRWRQTLLCVATRPQV